MTDASDEAAEADPVADTPEGPGHLAAPPGVRTAPLILAVSLAVVFAIAAAVLGVLLASHESSTEKELDAVRRSAGEFAELLVSYDFRDPEEHRDAVLEHSTGSFRDQYDAAFTQGLGQLITELKATSEGHVKEVFLTEVDDHQALAVVVLDIVTEGSAGRNPLYDVYIRLTLVEVDGEWFVDDVVDLSFGGQAVPGGTTTTTSTTTSVP